MRCDLHCPVPPAAGGKLAAVVVGGAVVLAVIDAVLGQIVIAAAGTVAVAVAAGTVLIRRELRRRVSTRAELLSALLAVRGVPPDPAAIAARARPVRGELAAPAVRLVEMRPAEMTSAPSPRTRKAGPAPRRVVARARLAARELKFRS